MTFGHGGVMAAPFKLADEHWVTGEFLHCQVTGLGSVCWGGGLQGTANNMQ